MLWQYYEQVEKAQIPGGKFEGVTGFASKSTEQAARIAAVLTLWLDLNALEVTAQTMAGAIVLAQYYLGETKRLSEAAEISTDTDMAERLRLWLLNSWPAIAQTQGRDPETIVPRDVVQFGPNAIRASEPARKHLNTLKTHGWIVSLPPGSEIGGMARKLRLSDCEGLTMLFDASAALEKLESEAPAPATTATKSPNKTANVTIVADVAAPKVQKSEKPSSARSPGKLPLNGTKSRYGQTSGGRQLTWTGKVVSLAEWRQLSEWAKHGSTGKMWNGKTQRWEES